MKGSAILHFESDRVHAQDGTCMIIHPDTACAHHGEKGQSCEILTWVWQPPPEFSSLQTGSGLWLKFQLPDAALKRISNIHAECRHEVETADKYSVAALAALRTRLDLVFARNHSSGLEERGWDTRIELALQWMNRNLESRQPIKDLCHYLNISAPTLFRGFQKQLSQSPRQCFQEMRLDRARRLLESGHLVKEAAVLLGYAHPNDLSRALRRK